MLHQNSVFHSLLKHVPFGRLARSVAKYGADAQSRTLDSKRHLIALLYGQFSGATSLREIVTGMASHETRLYHLGAAPVKRSTLSDANTERPWQVFGELFTEMLGQAHRGLRRAIAEAVRLIDSTSVRLSSLSADWATFSTDVYGAKAHIVYDPHADRPVYFAVTPARINDITEAKAMPIEPGMTYVYDLGYYDYGWWADLDAAGCRFVTRLKKNTPFTAVQENRVPPDRNILSDRIGHLPARLARSRKNPLQVPVREIRVVIETGKVLRIVTNDLDAPANEIADLMRPMLERLRALRGHFPGRHLTDGGFGSAQDIEWAYGEGVEVYCPPTQSKHGTDPYRPRRGDGEGVLAWRARMASEAGKVQYKRRSICECIHARWRNGNLRQLTVRSIEKVRAVVLCYALTNNILQGHRLATR